MEDVLEVYSRSYDAKRPQVCFDEAAKQILSEVREPIPPKPGKQGEQESEGNGGEGNGGEGKVERVDNEYKRNGTAALFMLSEPLAGRRRVLVKDRRTAKDFADAIRFMVEEMYPEADQIVLVLDNLNTHGPHSLYERFDPATARLLSERIEWHFTPKHGSWLNMAEIELSALATQCLAQRMESREHLEREIAAWERERNAASVTVDWQFTTADARIKLKRLYPSNLTS